MKKECCNIKVTETENGYCLEVEGDQVKEKCKEVMENCCTKDNIKNWFHSCCSGRK